MICEFALRQGFPVIEVQFWETDSCHATFLPDPRRPEY